MINENEKHELVLDEIEPNPNAEIFFNIEDYQWFMKLNRKDGFVLNKEKYPEWEPDDFAKAFMQCVNRYMQELWGK